MYTFWKKSPAAVMLGAAMITLLLLGWLQYRWLAEVSRGEQERMHDSLHVAAENFRDAFDREIARTYLTFQMDAATLRDRSWSRFSQRYTHWQATAPYPELVKAIFLVEVDQAGNLGVHKFVPEQGRFEQVLWPFELHELRLQLEQSYRALLAERPAPAPSLDPVYERLPALVVPLARSWLLSDRGELDIDADLIFSEGVLPELRNFCASCRKGTVVTPFSAHTVVVLNDDYIKHAFLPALVQRYMPVGESFDYNVAVVSRTTPARIVYTSDQELTAETLGTGDAHTDLLSIQFERLNRMLLDSSFRLDTNQGNGSVAQPRVAIGIIGAEDEADQQSGHWQLVLKHRAGSLEAAVARSHARNMVVNFGILLVLAASLTVLIISTQRAQHLARQQMQFAAAVSHELRTPLAVIRSAGENLADGLVHDPQKARQYGVLIRDEGRRLSDMIEQVLDFAGTQSGKKTYQFQPAEAEVLVEEVLAGLRTSLTEAGFTVEKSIQPDLPPLLADRVALKRSLQNLVSNAMKYAGSTRWVGLSVGLAATEAGQEIRVSVRDRGPGIDPEDLPHIFEPFYRGRSNSATPIHGSGLGLSLVKHAVEAHGGRVSVESIPGQGSSFTLHLPVALPSGRGEIAQVTTRTAASLPGGEE